MSGRRQWRGGSDGRQDDQQVTIEDDVLTVCQQRDAADRTDIEQQCRQELRRQRPPAWTEFAWMSVARGNWQGCPWYEPNDEDRRSAKAIIIMGWCILPAPILSPPALRIRCQKISGQNIQHEWVNTSDPHWQFSTSHSYLRPDEHCYRKVKSHKG